MAMPGAALCWGCSVAFLPLPMQREGALCSMLGICFTSTVEGWGHDVMVATTNGRMCYILMSLDSRKGKTY